MLGLLVFGIFSEYFQPGVISQAPASLRVRTNRMYKNAPVNFFGQACISIFRLGTVAMSLCLCFGTQDHFSFLDYLAINALILAIVAVKMIGNVLLDYTFSLSRRFGAVYEHYANIATLICLLLWPAILILLYVSSLAAYRWAAGIAAILFIALWVYRSAAQFITSPVALLYMLLYWCTLELLPLAALFYLSEITITTI